MDLLDCLTLGAYIALNVDLILQTRRIYQTKSSNDLSIIGLCIRYVVVFIVLAKFISLGDREIVFGQALIVLTFTAYFFLAIYYTRHRKQYRRTKSGRKSRHPWHSR